MPLPGDEEEGGNYSNQGDGDDDLPDIQLGSATPKHPRSGKGNYMLCYLL